MLLSVVSGQGTGGNISCYIGIGHIAYPQKLVYQSGFATVGVLLGIHIYVFRDTILKPHFSKNRVLSKTADNCVWYGFQAALGAGLQGLYTLQVNMSLQNLVHWGGAILFMSGAMQHAQLSTDLYMKHGPEFDVEVLDIPEIRQIAYFRSLILKYSSVMMFAPMILGQIFFASGNNTDNSQAETKTSEGTSSTSITTTTISSHDEFYGSYAMGYNFTVFNFYFALMRLIYGSLTDSERLLYNFKTAVKFTYKLSSFVKLKFKICQQTFDLNDTESI